MKKLYSWGVAGFLACTTASFTAPIFADDQAPAVAPAEEEGKLANFFKSIELSGFVDTYYSYNFSRPDNNLGNPVNGGRDGGNWVDVRAFDREDNSFTLDNVEISVFKPSTDKDPVGFGFTTNYGEIARRLTFVADETNTRVDGGGSQDFTISQGFVTYKAPIGKGLDFKVGKFATWIGAELWESVDNPNFSRSLLYQNAIPFTNTGIAMSYPVLDCLTVTGYFVNGWDTFVDNNKGKTAGYQFNWKIGQNSNFIVNGSHGPEQANDNSDYRHFWDLIYSIKVFEKTTFNLNADFGTEAGAAKLATVNRTGKWWGFSGIINQDITDSLGVAFRGEYLDDNDGAKIVVIKKIGMELLTGNH